MFREIVSEYLEVVVVFIAFVLFMAFGDCIAECVSEYGGL